MVRVELRALATVEGSGALSLGDVVVCGSDYCIEIWQEFMVVGSPAGELNVPSGRGLDVALVPYSKDTADMRGQTVTLHLKDGRFVVGVFDGNRLLHPGPLERPA